MTNNIAVTEGSGKVVSTEDIGGAQFQKIKVVDGRAGGSTGATVNTDGSLSVSVLGTVTVTGSVVAVTTGNQSVSGTIGASIIGTVPTTQAGTRITSIVSTVPSSVIVGASIFGQLPAGNAILGAVAASISGIVNISGSVVAAQIGTQVTSLVSTVPSSVIVGASIFGQLPAGTAMLGSVAALQGTNPWTIVHPAASITSITIPAGSITAVSATAPAGSILSITHPAGSVTGVRTDSASVITTQLAGSILAVSGTITTVSGNSSVMLLAGTNVIGSVTALQGTNPWVTVRPAGSVTAIANLAGSIAAVTATAPAGSVLTIATLAGSIVAVSATQSGTWATSVVGGPLNIGSILGTYQEETIGGPSIKGIALVWESNASTSVMSTVSPTNPLRILGSVSGTVAATQLAGSILSVTNPAGSITAITGTITTVTGNSSVMLLNSTTVIGSVAALQGTNPWTTVNPAASVTSITIPAGSVTAVSATAPAGSVLTIATLAGSIMSVSSTSPAGSIQSVTNPAGSITAVSAVQPAGSLLSIITPAGSVQGVRTDLASVITVLQGSSILAVPVGSVITISQASSIVGTYAEDSAHTSGDKGVFALQVRNDTMASITSTDGDYSPQAVGPVGEVIVANSPITKWITAQTSVMYGVSVQAIAAQGASVFTYVTGLQIANDSATFSRVKITGGLGSVLAWTVAPANGGSNIIFPNALRAGDNSGVSVSISGVSSVYVSMQGFISKA